MRDRLILDTFGLRRYGAITISSFCGRGYSRCVEPSKHCRELCDSQVELIELRTPIGALYESDLLALAFMRDELGEIGTVVACSI
jgi:hypothetical protein